VTFKVVLLDTFTLAAVEIINDVRGYGVIVTVSGFMIIAVNVSVAVPVAVSSM